MKQWITLPQREGTASRQAHADLPEGTYEREIGQDGFFGPTTHMHHLHAHTAWIDWEGPLRPRAYDLTKLDRLTVCPWQADLLLYNNHTKIRWWSVDSNMSHLVRNADGDDLLFIHEGQGHLYCDYGHLRVVEGDYVMLPKGTMWRLEPEAPMKILMVEATEDHYRLPDKGMMGAHAIFDPAIFDYPQLDGYFKEQQQIHQREWQIVIKRGHQLSTVTYGFNPLDAIGWHGNLMPVRVNWRDIRPLMSHRYHVPPSAHTTFVASRFVVCTFCPRPIESDPGALKVPFFHSNDDFDEVLLYHKGEFFSRDNIHPGVRRHVHNVPDKLTDKQHGI
jgi:homogentisate 1,2-dioxygenase